MEEEVERLQWYFIDVFEFLQEEMAAFRRKWENVAMFMRSLGRWVPLDWMAKEVKDRCKLDYDPKMIVLVEDHYLLHFWAVADCDAALKGGPWFVIGQLLAMEAWKPGFVPRSNTICQTVIWLRLFDLSIEY